MTAMTPSADPTTSTPLDAPEGAQTRTVVVSNTCQCRYCPSCEMGFQEDPEALDGCPECPEDGQYLGDCLGCWEDMTGWLTEVAEEWAELNPSPVNLFLIDGSGMGWRSRSGYKVVGEDDLDDLARAIGPDTEWLQRWSAEIRPGGEFKAVQSHHDAMGELYVVTPMQAEPCEWCDRLDMDVQACPNDESICVDCCQEDHD